MSGKRGGFRPNSVTQAILQHEAVKTMRWAGQQPKGRRKPHQQQQQQIAVPKEVGNDPHMAAHRPVDVNVCVVCQLLELFDEIESAANERADAQLAAELGISDSHEEAKDTNTISKGGKKKPKAKRGGGGANSTKQAASSSR